MANLLSTTVNGQLNTGNVIDLGYTVNGSIATTAFRGINFHSFGDLNYYIGKPSGAWTQPLHIHFYTGIWIRSHHSYGGTRFYNIATGSNLMSIGDGADNINVYAKITSSITSGTVLSHGSMDDAIGWNSSYGTYIGSTVGGTYYIYGNGRFYDNGTIRTLIHSGNIGSQSVNYASSAGNADTLDGYHANTVGNRHFTARGFTVDGDANTYYPVIIPGSAAYAFNRYSIYRNYGWQAPWDPIGTGAHKGGLTFDFEWSGDTAWGGNDHTLRVVQFSEQYTNMVAGLALPVTGGVCVWLRGGGAYYECQVDGYPVTPTVYLSGFTAANGAVFSARTDTSNVSTEIYNRMPVRNSSEIYDGGNRVIHSGGDQSKSGYLQSNSSLRAPIFYDSNDTGFYGDFASTSRMNTIVYDNLRWAGDQNYGIIDRNGYLDTVNGIGTDPLELNYYSGGDVKVGAGVYGSKNLYASMVYVSGGNAVIHAGNIGSQSVNYASSAGNADTVDSLHAGDFVRAYTTTSDNIDSDWGQSFKTFDPVPSGTPPLSSPNIRTINIGENFSRRTQLAFDYASDVAYFRRRDDGGWRTWREFIHSGNIGSQSVSYATSASNADTVDGYHETAFVRLAANSNSPTNGTFAIGSASSRNFIQSHSGQPLDINPLGNSVTVGSSLSVSAQVITSSKFRYSSSVADDSGFGLYFSSDESTGYAIYREAGAWNFPYPDLRISFHTGIKLGANATYEGIRFYTDTDMSDQVMSVNNGSDPLGGGNVYVNRSLQAGNSLRAPIFYDSNDTTYYLDPNNTLLGLKIAGNIDMYARSASWAEGIRVRVPSTSTWGGIRFTRDRGNDDGNWAIGFTGIDSTDDLTFWGNTGGTGAMRMRLDQAANLITYGSMRAPIFYDSNDTGYYLDPNSTSNLLTVNVLNTYVGNAIYFGGGNNYFNWTSGRIHSNVGIQSENSMRAPQLRVTNSTNNAYITGNSDWGLAIVNDNGFIQFGPANNSWSHIYSDKSFYFNQDLYVNGTRVVLNSGTWGINVTGTAGGVSWANVSSKPATWLNEPNLIQGSEPDTIRASGFYESYLGSGNPTGTWMNYINVRHSNTANGHGFQLGMSYYDNNLWFRSYSGNIPPSFQSWSRALGTNTDPYPSNMNQYVRTTDDVTHNSTTSPTFVVNNHSDNTKGYRIHNTSGSSVSAMFTNSSNQLVIAAGAVDQINLNKKVYVNGVALGVNVSPSATAGRIDASNDIVAYSSSDERLKYNITPIENAIDKVRSLTGVEFDWKPEYKHAHGYEGHDTGIIAQQVQEVIPSAVRTNDTGFLAVRYEKLIGLLVEGMKEQQAQIEELKAKLDGIAR